MVKKNEKRIKKEKFFERVYNVFDKYTRALLVECNNISAKQIHQCRKELRTNNSLMLMGKNTLIKAALQKRISEPTPNEADYEERKATWTPVPHMEPLVRLLKGNLGIIFTHHDLTDIKDIIDKHAREAPAKVGSFAQCDVFIEAGPTGLDPKQTAFFQNLQIPTKIVKAQIEITAKKQIIEVGEKVGSNEAALLQKLVINPFSYRLKVAHVFDNGNVYGPGVLDITAESIISSYQKVIANTASISLELGIPTKASAPHSILRVFKNLVAVTFECDFTFAQADAMKSAAAAGPVAAAVVEKVEEVEEAPKEEPADDFGGGAADLFGGEDDY
uniref:Acidic ribosomal P0 protein n=1 Tax=Euplotes focardii TaxID=36767 RepID=Q52H52_EUPFO|nr:acidic ribosomal P0 protein [Euplotes focardii]